MGEVEGELLGKFVRGEVEGNSVGGLLRSTQNP